MNSLLRFNREERPEATMGSGRYYARFSQGESAPTNIPNNVSTTWLFEAFDAVWFDETPAPETPEGLPDYYERAFLLILELRTRPSDVKRFRALAAVEKAELEDDEGEEWFVFEATPSASSSFGEGELPLTIYSNLYQAGIEASAKDVRPADSSVQQRLRKVVNTEHILSASEKDVDDALAGVAGTQIEWAVVYDVGQGNAIGLCNEKGLVETYSDLGGGVLGHAGTFPTSLKNFCFTKTPPIILSHWDFDHWSSANRDPRSLQLTWIAPRQSVGPTHAALMASIVSAGGRLLLVPNTLPAKWRGQLYLELCAGKGRNHSGIALALSQKGNGEGALMLFPGDARYPALPSFKSVKDYLCVVAPHHGGDMRNRRVPYCANQPVSRLAYSYGQPNTYGHPAKVTRTDHDKAGWHDSTISPSAQPHYVRETVHRISGQPGHILLSWLICTTPPPLPCGGSSCQLQAQQL